MTRYYSLLAVLAAFLPHCAAQGGSQVPILYDEAHNATKLSGTWSTGSGAVQTGPGFCNPANFSFNYPATAGRSWSFSDDGFFEQAEYRFSANPSDPHCITAVITYQHGTYQLLDNGSITAEPFAPDGRQQVQQPCAATSNQLNQWNQTYLFQSWRIFALPGAPGAFHLNLFAFDGSPYAPMNLVARPPNMLPTKQLTDVAVVPQQRRELVERSGAVARGASVGLGALLLALASLVVL